MNMHAPKPSDDDNLACEFVARMAVIWAKHHQDPDELAGAMLAWAVNQTLETGEPHEVAALLIGLAAQVCPPEAAGHA